MEGFKDFGLKLVYTVILICTRFVSMKGQGHSLTFDLGLASTHSSKATTPMVTYVT